MGLFLLHKADRQVIIVLLTIAVLAIVFILMTGEENTDSETAVVNDSTITTNGRQSSPILSDETDIFKPERFVFDPNTADSTQLLRLGLQPWQVRSIYKYRAHGGIFREKSDFARVPGLTVKQYRELEPYISIGRDYQPASVVIAAREHAEKDSLYRSQKLAENETIELSSADTTELKRVPGIGDYYARQIIEYRERLGGYVSIDQLDEIDGFPQKAKQFLVLTTSQPLQLNLNQLSLKELRRHPYINYYQARAIIDYRRTEGKINSLDDLRLLRDFPQEAIDKLKPYVCF